jgi:hypothetical protein
MTIKTEMIHEIVTDFKERGWDSNPMERALEVVISSPESAVELLKLALDEIPKGGTFLDAAICFMPDDAFAEMAELALERFGADRRNRLAEDVIHYCSLQSVGSLHPHLDTIFKLAPNSGTYYECWPWRESGQQHFAYLGNVLENDGDSERRFRAWNAMLETREPEVLQFAMAKAHRASPSGRREAYLLLVGFEFAETGLRKLYTDSVYHVFFPSDYLPAERAPLVKWRNVIRQHHPTWKLVDNCAPKMRFGGQSQGRCACCGGELHHFITLEPIPATLKITGLEQLELATCLSCLGWEQQRLFYTHDQNGQLQQAGFDGARIEPQFPAVAFKPTEVQIVQISPRWQWQNDAASNGRENLNRVGGDPCWIQDSEYPTCPECGKRMVFLLQITSDLPTIDGGEWMWGDSGICYSFWCDECKVSGYLWQCY